HTTDTLTYTLYLHDALPIFNLKNKLIGWASKNGKSLDFQTVQEKLESGRRIFTIAAVLDGEVLSEGKGFNKKDASQIAAQLAIRSEEHTSELQSRVDLVCRL